MVEELQVEVEVYEAAVETTEATEAAEVAEQAEQSDAGWEAEALEKIKLARAHVAEMEAKHLLAKEAAKDAKADWESAVNWLTEAIDTATRPLPLFDQQKASNSPAESSEVDSSDSDAWKTEPITALGLPDSCESFIQSAGYNTLGEFSAYMAANGDFWCKDLTVGGTRKPPRFQQQVEDAWAEFWAGRKVAAK